MRARRITVCSVLAFFVLAATGCGQNKGARPTLRLSMIPTTDPGKVIRESQPFVDYLEQKPGAKVELTVPANYAPVVEAFANNRVDIAYGLVSSKVSPGWAPTFFPDFCRMNQARDRVAEFDLIVRDGVAAHHGARSFRHD